MYSIAYVALIVLINIGFAHVPLINGWPPMSLAVGLVFVVRDFAQREVGHKVLLLMLLGAAVSYEMASPAIAVASCAAYLVSELTDWVVYTFSKWPLRQRVLLSSMLGTPVDSAVFLYLIGFFSLSGVLLMTASKMIAALTVYFWLPKETRHV